MDIGVITCSTEAYARRFYRVLAEHWFGVFNRALPVPCNCLHAVRVVIDVSKVVVAKSYC